MAYMCCVMWFFCMNSVVLGGIPVVRNKYKVKISTSIFIVNIILYVKIANRKGERCP